LERTIETIAGANRITVIASAGDATEKPTASGEVGSVAMMDMPAVAQRLGKRTLMKLQLTLPSAVVVPPGWSRRRNGDRRIRLAEPAAGAPVKVGA